MQYVYMMPLIINLMKLMMQKALSLFEELHSVKHIGNALYSLRVHCTVFCKHMVPVDALIACTCIYFDSSQRRKCK